MTGLGAAAGKKPQVHKTDLSYRFGGIGLGDTGIKKRE
jgi:hypothetical protein